MLCGATLAFLQHSPTRLPCRRWTRVLLLQQLLVEVFDLLDPDL